MNVGIAHSGNAASHEVPDGDAAVVAAHGQQSATPVERTREGLAARVQDAIIVLEYVCMLS